MNPAGLSLAARLAMRELRSGLQGFRIFVMCLFLGVGAIAIVGSMSAAIERGIASQGQPLLGGDAEFSIMHREIAEDEKAFLQRAGTLSQAATLRAMATSGDQRSLVEIKAVDDLYPLFGKVELADGSRLHDALANRSGRWGVVAEPVLLDRLGIKPGALIRVGEAEFQVRAAIVREPDRVSDGFILGPRLLMSRQALDTTGLVKPGSLVRWRYRVKLAGKTGAKALRALIKGANKTFPDAGWRVRNRKRAAPGVERFIDRLTYFLTLAGLTSLIIGGVGVANAVKTFMEARRRNIATLKCLGASSRLILSTYLIEVLTVASIGVSAGLVLGAVAPFIASAALVNLLPVPVTAQLEWIPLLQAAAFGYLVTIAFAIWPLGHARDISPSALFRDNVAGERHWPGVAYVMVSLLAIALLCLLAFSTLAEGRITLWYIGGVTGAFVILTGLAWLIMQVSRNWLNPSKAASRYAIANLYRPGAPTPSIILSLGLGLTLFVTLALVDTNISSQLRSSLPKQAPDFFFVDVANTERDAFVALIKAQPKVREIKTAPMLRGRVTRVAGVRADEVEATPDTAWALRGDRGLTYAQDLPEGSELTEGSWWDADYSGPPLVSFTHDIAEGINLRLGDEVRVNVLGREVVAKVASFRRVDWRSLNINFVMVFSPNTLQGAPHMNIVTVSVDDDVSGQLLKTVSAAFPTVTAVRVKDALDAVNDLLGKLLAAVRAASAMTFVVGVIVLAGAMASGLAARIYDAVVLKTFGATRRQLIAAYVLEFTILGLSAAVFAVAIGAVAAWAIMRFVMEMPFEFSIGVAAATALVAMGLTVAAGLVTTWSALGSRPARMLRV